MRYILSGLLGGVISFSLFLVMHYMIQQDEVDIVNPPQIPAPEYATAKVPPKDTKPTIEPPPEPIDNIVPDVVRITDIPNPSVVVDIDGIEAVSVAGDVTGIKIGVPETGIIYTPPAVLKPEYRAAPRYPERLLRRGIEGYVMVENTVDQEGNVVHVEIIESSHSGFEGAVRNSVVRWTYAKSDEKQRKHREKVAFQIAD